MIHKNFFSYEELVLFLNSSKVSTIDLTLDRVTKVLDVLDNPQNKIKYIHIAGTNGKGSVLKYLETIAMNSNKVVGSFTSPHLIDYTERIKVNNNDISRNDLITYANKVTVAQNSIDNGFLTTFEFLTVLAFLYFYEMNIDLGLIEVGLGGRLDASNVIQKPLLSVITHINIDHKDILGDTIDKIAYEKAGIIKNNSKVLTLSNNMGIKTIQRISKQNNAELIIANTEMYSFFPDTNNLCQFITDLSNNITYEISMIGDHQFENFVLALESAKLLEMENFISLKGLEKTIKSCLWPGRAQYFKDYNILIDGAHNLSGAISLRNLLNKYFYHINIVWIIAILSTKDYESILKSMISPDDSVIFTKLKNSTADLSTDLFKFAQNNNLCKNIFYENTLQNSLKGAKKLTKDPSLIVISGSLYLVGEFLEYIKN